MRQEVVIEEGVARVGGRVETGAVLVAGDLAVGEIVVGRGADHHRRAHGDEIAVAVVVVAHLAADEVGHRREPADGIVGEADGAPERVGDERRGADRAS